MTTPEELTHAFNSENRKEVKRAKVLEWMEDGNIEVLGALYAAITDQSRAELIEPRLSIDDYYGFVFPYLTRCMAEDPKSDWNENRHIAGHELQNWIRAWLSDSDAPQRADDVKRRLGDFYKGANKPLRAAIVNAVLEHLFELPRMRALFADWKSDPILNLAYQEALLWSNSGSEKLGSE